MTDMITKVAEVPLSAFASALLDELIEAFVAQHISSITGDPHPHQADRVAFEMVNNGIAIRRFTSDGRCEMIPLENLYPPLSQTGEGE